MIRSKTLISITIFLALFICDKAFSCCRRLYEPFPSVESETVLKNTFGDIIMKRLRFQGAERAIFSKDETKCVVWYKGGLVTVNFSDNMVELSHEYHYEDPSFRCVSACFNGSKIALLLKKEAPYGNYSFLIINFSTGRCIWRADFIDSRPSQLFLNQNENLLIIKKGSSIEVLDISTENPVPFFSSTHCCHGYNTFAQDIHVRAHSVSDRPDYLVDILNVNTGARIKSFTIQGNNVNDCICPMSPDCSKIVSSFVGGKDLVDGEDCEQYCVLDMWNANNGEKLWEKRKSARNVYLDYWFSSDSNYFLVRLNKERWEVFDSNTGDELLLFPNIREAAFIPGRNEIFVLSADSIDAGIYNLNTRTYKCLNNQDQFIFTTIADYAFPQSEYEESELNMDFHFNFNGSKILTFHKKNRQIKIWDTNTCSLSYTFELPELITQDQYYYKTAFFSPSGNKVVAIVEKDTSCKFVDIFIDKRKWQFDHVMPQRSYEQEPANKRKKQ